MLATGTAAAATPPLAKIKVPAVVYQGQPVEIAASPDATPGVSHRWSLEATPENVPVSLTGADQPRAACTPPALGNYVVQLVATRGAEETRVRANFHAIVDPKTDPGFAYEGSTKLAYKQAPDAIGGLHTLHLHVVKPAGWKAADRRPAIVLFHGGGWNRGEPGRHLPDCAYFASRGLVAITAEYRVGQRQGTTPVECVADAKSAVRFVRAHAAELGIDPDRLAAGGGSAGGHIAACAATLTTCDDATDDLSVSCVPSALALYYPVLEMDRRGVDISPLHFVGKATPPTILLMGEKDTIAPASKAQAYAALMQAAGAPCRVFVYRNVNHPAGPPKSEFALKVENDYRRQIDLFLISLGWLQGEPTIPPAPELVL